MPDPQITSATSTILDSPRATFNIPNSAIASAPVPSITILPGLHATLTMRLSPDLLLPAEDQAHCAGQSLAAWLEETINAQLMLYLGC